MKTPLTALPSDSFVTQALDELIADTQSLLDSSLQTSPRDKEEISFWKRQRNSFVNAQADYLAGTRPLITPSGYLMPSISRPGGLMHRCWQLGGIWTCSCEAGEKGLFHRHTALISAIERAAELESLAAQKADLVGGGDPPVDIPDEPYPPTPGGPEPPEWRIGRYVAESLLQSRLDATEAQLAVWRSAQQRRDPEHIANQARAAYARANQPSYRRPLFADRDAETMRRQALSEERAVLLEARARRHFLEAA